MRDGPPRVLLFVALGVAVAAAVAVLTIAIVRSHRVAQQGPLEISAVPAPQADTPECKTLMAALPQHLADFERATPADPVPPATAAWRSAKVAQPVVLRCGVGQPAEFVVGVQLQEINGVEWFPLPDPATARTTYLAVDRPVYVALTVPDGSGGAPVQEIADVLAAKLPAVAPRPGPPK
ncbi:MAG TPA: DUF3515 domain-containing protein [Mycobacterium sp.]|nr:DUF3515 domain-containing protein [Mycobacterium sp.]